MTPFPANLRYERKFLAEPLSLAEVLALLRRHPAQFREAYPPRSVNNIYLDSRVHHGTQIGPLTPFPTPFPFA